ncbi:SMC5-SMC6 complex localization factor protein 2 isoform X1 [Chiroxiphia lanceolata]|uniref:SMC5-SMC6 complex localization factor protein 2 isoform X1 n=1 Tax=Chiroxiphia lanceolata TaxID=296741 RepID=UPI0013CEEC6C|nr:SMC5-SMC6 complex localization factor protein 2 isoform X1 [Chiroxiphia lanceolata]
MTRPLGEGLPSPGPPVAMSRRHVTLAAAGREVAQDGRNQTITEFFKPVLSQDLGRKDRIVLCSPDRGNVKDAGMGLSVLRAEGFERKISSPKKVRRKRCQTKHQTSPVVDGFRKRIEEKDSVNILENGRVWKASGSLYPKAEIKKLFVTAGSLNNFLAKEDKTVKPEQERNESFLGVGRAPLSYGNSWEEKNDCVDLADTSSDSDKCVSPPEADARKACARNTGTVSTTSLCQSPGFPLKLPCSPTDSAFRLSLEAPRREREQKKQELNHSKPHPVKPFSGTSVLHQGNGCPLGKIPCFSSRETASDDPSQPKLKQVLKKHEASSPHAFRTSSEMTSGLPKSPAIPSHCLPAKVSSGTSKQRDSPGKRKQTAMSVDEDSSDQSDVSSLNDSAFSRSSSKCKNRRTDFVKHILLKSTHDDVMQLRDVAALSRHDSTLSKEHLNSSEEKEKNNCSTVGLPSSYSAHSPNKNNHISVVDTKENQLQLANSCFLLEKSLPFSQEKSTVLPSLHCLTQTKSVKSPLKIAGLSQVLDASKKEQDGKKPERHEHNKAHINSIQYSNSFSKPKHRTLGSASDSYTMEVSGELAPSEETGINVPLSLPLRECCKDSSHTSSQSSGELKVENTSTDKSKLNGKSQSGFDSEDEILESVLDYDDDDDDDEEEAFMPLQKVLCSSLKPQIGTPEESCDSFSQDTVTPLLKLHLSKTPPVTKVSYVNSLENLLKEKEESRRVDELEKRLQEDIEREDSVSDGENEENASGDEDLSEEHRAFTKRFSVVVNAIPDYHPGEDIFDLSASGQIFNQHNLDLRNFYLIPQNPVEKLLLNSGIKQQLYLAVGGFLSSSYSCILCPIPILKWLFQMMSIHPDHCVSTQILDRLMELTLKSSSISDEHSKLWIPSIADISVVFVNMGVEFRSLFPLQHLQPNFNKHDILSQVQEAVSQQQPREDLASASPAFSSLLENNLINVIKFLGFCTTVIQDGYTDEEIWLLLLLLFKISLEKQLKRVPLVDLQCLFVKLLMSIKDWDTKMPGVCVAVSELSDHHHNLLWLVQLVPSWTVRGRELRRRLSLVIISKLLHKKHIEIPDDSDEQMSLLHQFVVCMKPSVLLKKMRKMREGLEEQNAYEDHLNVELEQEAYYLIYILLHLVSEASFFDVVNSNQRQHILKLCRALDRYVKGDIREDARLFYRSKVKDLAARIHTKWQDVIQTTRLTQGKLHDFWEPDS